MRSIKLPEPPGSVTGMPEIFDRGISCVVRRAVIIGNGAAGAENQCIGVVRALGLSGNCTIHVCKSLEKNHSAFDLVFSGSLVLMYVVPRELGLGLH
jgi:hypothetical protein